jgi:hypothetical protein
MRKQREGVTRLLINHTVNQIEQTTPAQVRDITDYSFRYLENVMKAGAYESVCFPFFGKFVARLKQIRYREASKARPKKVRSVQ